MNISPRMLLLGGLAIVGLTNLIALGGVAYNRAAPPASTLQLSDREFAIQRGWSAFDSQEDSSLSIKLVWDVRSTDIDTGTDALPMWGRYSRYLGNSYIAWLGEEKLKSLGIDIRLPAERPGEQPEPLKDLGRDVYLVLELNGPAYRAALEAASARAASATRALADHPDDRSIQAAANAAAKTAQQEAERSTRLFVVDAGVDADALHRMYPDASRYAIAKGHVRPIVVSHAGPQRLTGEISDLRAESINVPLQFRSALEPLAKPALLSIPAATSQLFVDVSFGRRHEPWITAVHTGASQAPAG